jgi:hypothetical protein
MLNLLNTTDDVRNISWKTLHEWVQQYPYAQHLRLIAARKAKLENNIDLQVLLELAATYAPSRRFLYEYLAAPQNNPITQTNMNDNHTVSPSVAENIDTAAEETPIVVEETAIVVEETATVVEETPTVVEETATVVEETATVVEETPIVVEETATVAEETATVVEETAIVVEETPIVVEETPIVAETVEVSTKINTESDSFGNWLAMLGGIAMPTAATATVIPLPSPEDEHEDLEDINAENEVRHLAQRSVETNHDIISETLAKLLEIQGKNTKAIEMYQQLSLKHPEKASVFAARIADLVQK